MVTKMDLIINFLIRKDIKTKLNGLSPGE